MLVTPDDIYNTSENATAFIFGWLTPAMSLNNDNHKIFYGETTHGEIIRDNPQELSQEVNDLHGYKFGADGYCGWLQYCLFGRVGYINYNRYSPTTPPGNYCAFWNTNKEIYDKLLQPCLQQLQQDNLLPPDTIISTPLGMSLPPNATNTKPKSPQQLAPTNPQNQIDQFEIQRKLHLMQGDEKKQAMQNLGVGGRAKNPWQDAMEKANLIAPGHKYWAATSESTTKIKPK